MEEAENNQTQEELEQRRQWFDWYVNQLDTKSVVSGPAEGIVYRCPCCGNRTLSERGGYDICPVCFWEDDGQDDQDANTVRGGPNRSLSLTQARANYRLFGASDEIDLKHVRPPTDQER